MENSLCKGGRGATRTARHILRQSHTDMKTRTSILREK